MDPVVYFRCQSATAHVSMLKGENVGFVNSLYSGDPRKGHATAVMAEIANWADEHGVLLHLTCQAYGRDPHPDNWELHDFYSRFGFVRNPERGYPIRMTREPSQVLQAS